MILKLKKFNKYNNIYYNLKKLFLELLKSK